ncbi:MAG TPA: protein kinase [Candidatus Acidoferrales bacterium]|nr:protein kinase [Candidatus Acidoferrales bacterium]
MTVGQTLAHYQLVEKLGEGGMGVVFKARDLSLDRFVALKLLSVPRMGDESRQRRFIQEAKAASALNHPGIVTIHEIDRAGDAFFIVMEYVEGKTLEHLIGSRGLALPDALSYGAQIADALACAHAAGIVHRDIKPGNIIVAGTGRIKVVDFGLAKLTHPEESVSGESALTVTAAGSVHTGESVILGTIAYMSPEQAQGRKIDARSDIFSLGSVLYEMITGRCAFATDNRVSTLAAIIAREPQPARTIISGLPPEAERIISRCLRKEPGRRFQHMEDLKVALEELKEETGSGSGASAQAPSRVPSRARVRAGAVGFALFIGLILAYLGFERLLTRRAAPIGGIPANPRLRLVIAAEGELLNPSLSPDGKMIVYAATEEGRTNIFVQRVSGGARIRLTDGPARDEHPHFSPDGEHISFTRHGSQGTSEICVIPALGGDVSCPVRDALDAAWSPDGRRLAFIVLRPSEAEALAVSAIDGSGARVVFRGDSGLPFLRNPAWSPRGDQIALVRSSGGVAGEVWLAPVAGGAARRLTSDPTGIFSAGPVFTPDGQAVLHQSNRAGATNLWAVRISGGVLTRVTTGAGPDELPSVARDGTIAFASVRTRTAIFVHDLGPASNRQLTTTTDLLWAPSFSPDGRDIAFSRGELDGSWHIWLVPVSGGSPRRLTSGPLPEIYSRFSPDGEWVLYNTWSAGPDRVWRVPRQGGAPQPLTPARSEDDQYADLSRNGRWLAFVRTENGKVGIYVAGTDGSSARLVVPPEATVPSWSPDSQWIAFSRSRRFHVGGIYVVRAGGTDLRQLSETGSWPVWWPDGKRIAYLDMAADGTEQIFTVSADGGKPAPLSGLHMSGSNNRFDIAPDGRSIAFVDPVRVSAEVWLMESPRSK